MFATEVDVHADHRALELGKPESIRVRRRKRREDRLLERSNPRSGAPRARETLAEFGPNRHHRAFARRHRGERTRILHPATVEQIQRRLVRQLLRNLMLGPTIQRLARHVRRRPAEVLARPGSRRVQSLVRDADVTNARDDTLRIRGERRVRRVDVRGVRRVRFVGAFALPRILRRRRRRRVPLAIVRRQYPELVRLRRETSPQEQAVIDAGRRFTVESGGGRRAILRRLAESSLGERHLEGIPERAREIRAGDVAATARIEGFEGGEATRDALHAGAGARAKSEPRATVPIGDATRGVPKIGRGRRAGAETRAGGGGTLGGLQKRVGVG